MMDFNNNVLQLMIIKSSSCVAKANRIAILSLYPARNPTFSSFIKITNFQARVLFDWATLMIRSEST